MVKILRDVPLYGESGKVERIVHAVAVQEPSGPDWGFCQELKGFMFLDEKPQGAKVDGR